MPVGQNEPRQDHPWMDDSTAGAWMEMPCNVAAGSMMPVGKAQFLLPPRADELEELLIVAETRKFFFSTIFTNLRQH